MLAEYLLHETLTPAFRETERSVNVLLLHSLFLISMPLRDIWGQVALELNKIKILRPPLLF